MNLAIPPAHYVFASGAADCLPEDLGNRRFVTVPFRPSRAHAALALPRIPRSIPPTLHVAGAKSLATPLAIALLEAGVATEAMLAPASNRLIDVLGEPDERELAMLALSTWWDALRARHSFQLFRWHLHVQDLVDLTGATEKCTDPVGWFCITRNTNTDIPRLSLARRVGELEALRAGFGQTVLALLMDATTCLPESLTPWAAGWMAEAYYWDGTDNDEELLEYRMQEYGYATVEDLLADTGDLMTRARFYQNIHRWATLPQRVLTREEIGRAARAGWAREVVLACDAIAAAVQTPEFKHLHRDEVGSNRAGDCVDGCVVLLWHGPGDEIGNVIDYVLDMHWNAGESHEFIDAQPVPLTRRGIRQYMRRTEQMLKLAELTERLLLLIGEPCE